MLRAFFAACLTFATTSAAFAQEVSGEVVESATNGAANPSPVNGLLMMVAMLAVLYFLLLRPQQKKLNEHKKMLSELRRGDKVVTAGGIIGTISKLEGDDIAQVEIAPEVRVRIAKGSIASVLTRTEPAGKTDKEDAANEN